MTGAALEREGAPEAAAAPLLEVRNLHTAFAGAQGSIFAASGVSFSLAEGETKGLVGESGSGKSVTLLSLLGLVPESGRVVEGEVLWGGRDLLELPAAELRAIRGREIAMVFQDPTTCLNPVYTIGEQIAETLRVKLGSAGGGSRARDASCSTTSASPRRSRRARRLSARALRRHAPARDDRDRARVRAAAAAGRRADDRARRDDPGADPRPAGRAAGRVRHGDDARLARPRRRRAELRPGRGDVRRARRRGRTRRGRSSAPRGTRTRSRC